MEEKYDLDNLDRKILSELLKDARVPFSEMARKFGVSSGTIHVRMEKLQKAKIVEGSRIKVNFSKLGYSVCCFVGINLKSARDYPMVLKNLRNFDEIVEVYYTTGSYSIFSKVLTKSIDQLHNLLVKKIQSIPQVHSTETLISLDNPIHRDAALK